MAGQEEQDIYLTHIASVLHICLLARILEKLEYPYCWQRRRHVISLGIRIILNLLTGHWRSGRKPDSRGETQDKSQCNLVYAFIRYHHDSAGRILEKLKCPYPRKRRRAEPLGSLVSRGRGGGEGGGRGGGGGEEGGGEEGGVGGGARNW